MDFYVVAFVWVIALLIGILVVSIVDAVKRRKEAKEDAPKTLEEILEEENAKKAFVYAKYSEVIDWLIACEQKGKLDLSLLSEEAMTRGAALAVKTAEDEYTYALIEYDRINREIAKATKGIAGRPESKSNREFYEDIIKTLKKQKVETIHWMQSAEALLEELKKN
ncbi:hypothetical protein IKE98_01220 [Candidatus Saccharibacteria bacterium]|nr:hypothetical protein [Candidatus Saccharibacteria bacterium]